MPVTATVTPVKWPGGKAVYCREILEVILATPRRVNLLVDLFCGSAVIGLTVVNRFPVILNDINGELIHFFRVCREQPEELAGYRHAAHATDADYAQYEWRATIQTLLAHIAALEAELQSDLGTIGVGWFLRMGVEPVCGTCTQGFPRVSFWGDERLCEVCGSFWRFAIRGPR